MFNPEFRVSINAGDGGKYYIGGLEYDSFRDSVGFLLFNEKGAKVFAKDGFRPLEQLQFAELDKVSKAAQMSRTALNYGYELYSRLSSLIGADEVVDLAGIDEESVALTNADNQKTVPQVTSISRNENGELSGVFKIKNQSNGEAGQEYEEFDLPLAKCALETISLVADTFSRKYPEKGGQLKSESSQISSRMHYENDLSRYIMRATTIQDGNAQFVLNLDLSGGKDPEITFQSGCLKYDDELGAVVYGQKEGENGMEIVKMPVSSLSAASLKSLNDAMTVRYPSWAAYYGQQCARRDKAASFANEKSVKKSQGLIKSARFSYSPSL